MNKLLIIVLACGLLLFGCPQSEPVEEPAVQAEAPVEPEPAPAPQKTYECPDGTIVTDLNDCPTCPENCDDGNPCTDDFCSSETGYGCSYDSLEGSQLACSGPAGDCTEYSCVHGECTIIEQVPCCGNEACEEGEDCSTCSIDCSCEANLLCCEGGCRAPYCLENSDCNDGDPMTEDVCSGEGCEATCLAEDVECGDGDGLCPSDCSAMMDDDCPVYGLGDEVRVSESLEIELIRSSRLHCQEFAEDYGEFTAIYVEVRNPSYHETSVPIYAHEFVLIDKSGKEYSEEAPIGGCDANVLSDLDGLKPGSERPGSLWYSSGSTTITGKIKIVYNPDGVIDGDEVVWEFYS